MTKIKKDLKSDRFEEDEVAVSSNPCELNRSSRKNNDD